MLILFSQLRKWKKLRRRRMREATTRLPSISGRPLVTEKINVALGGAEPAVRSRCCGMSMPAALLSANQSSVIRLHWLTFKDASVEAVSFLILAITSGKVLRTKPQNLLIRLPIQNLEAVA